MGATSINKSRLFKRAWYLFKQGYNGTFSYCLKRVWAEMKQAVIDAIAKIEMAAAPKYINSTFAPSAETMCNFYHSSCYKGD
jgi:hypothetical protein